MFMTSRTDWIIISHIKQKKNDNNYLPLEEI